MSYQSNIRKLYLIKIFNGFLFAVPIIYTVLNTMGLSAIDLFILSAVYAMSVVVFEIPTGFFGDKHSRKLSLGLGAICGCIGYLTYFSATGFWGFLLGEIILGLGGSFMSGADTALLYDSVVAMNKTDIYKKISGIYTGLFSFAEGIGALISGLVATQWLQLPFLMDAICYALIFCIILTLREPPIERFCKESSSISQLKEVYTYITHGHEYIGWLIIFNGIMGSISLVLVRTLQTYTHSLGVSLWYVGVIWAVMNIFVGVFQLIAHKYESRLGIKNTVFSLIGLRGIFLVIAGFLGNIYGLVSFIVFAFIRAGGRAATDDVMQLAVVSKMRATIGSVQSLVFRFGFVILGPLMGYMTDSFGLSIALYIFAGIATVVCLLTFLQFWKRFSPTLIAGE